MALVHELQSALGHSYNFERELAGGGMSRVFVAEETRLGRKVAIKVLPPEIAESLKIERFTREIRLLARLQHPHIVPVLSAGEACGIPYYTMPMIAGESLREKLTREGRLEINEAMRVVNEVADALAYAHAEGVLHRDIKPENILLAGGGPAGGAGASAEGRVAHALVVDFGIAKAIDASKSTSPDVSPSSGIEALTHDGVALGTPAYVSPEQALGDPAVDARSDVYSLAAVLFEMLSGKPPFSGPTAALIIGKRFVETPARLDTIDPTIPPGIAQAVARAMALAPDDRFASASDFAAALRTTWHREDRLATPDRRTAPERSIAVLPFTNSAGDADGEYFSDGITEEIINAISKIPGIRAVARTSCFSFKGKAIDIGLVGERLNVATVLEGSVRRSGGRIRVTTQLINVADGYQLWSERYDRGFDDIFTIQDDIARSIVEHLRVTLAGSSEQGLVSPGTENVEAYDLNLKGRHFWRLRGPGLATAVEYFKRAIAADPEFAAPHAGLADCHSLMAVYGWEPSVQAVESARSAAYRALALDPRSAESHAAVGLFELWMGWDFEVAKRELRRAAQANPTWAVPVAWLGQLAILLGRNDEANAAARRAREIEPLSPLIAFLAATVFVLSRSFPEADDAAKRAIELDPTFPTGYLAAGWVHHHYQRYDDAVAAFRRGAELTNRCPLVLAPLGCGLVDAGRLDEAQAILHELEARPADAWHLAQLQWKLGNEDYAFGLLDRAVQERNTAIFTLARSPGLESLVRHPRWVALLHRHGQKVVAAVFEAQTRADGAQRYTS